MVNVDMWYIFCSIPKGKQSVLHYHNCALEVPVVGKMYYIPNMSNHGLIYRLGYSWSMGAYQAPCKVYCLKLWILVDCTLYIVVEGAYTVLYIVCSDNKSRN